MSCHVWSDTGTGTVQAGFEVLDVAADSSSEDEGIVVDRKTGQARRKKKPVCLSSVPSFLFFNFIPSHPIIFPTPHAFLFFIPPLLSAISPRNERTLRCIHSSTLHLTSCQVIVFDTHHARALSWCGRDALAFTGVGQGLPSLPAGACLCACVSVCLSVRI